MAYRINIISNEIVFLTLIRNFIKKIELDIQISETDSLNMLYKELKENSFDLIIVDGNFSENSAIDLLYIIRFKLKIFTPIWFFTVIQTPEYYNKALQVGANVIIERPFDPIEIASQIHEFLHNKVSVKN
ncbi:MAG TPA: response regulator [Paludibacteraceae bacterium]|jgi:DNA-binding response OmpR family regulator|nr:response regulator [Paludibacteraceae bacterium]OPZ02088.1 MAG: Response regulator receiver domain protein [Bacteroidetes bacterium ADurb.BinA395]MBP8967584.1 response regulator [Paludibacteraceae bacterium]HOF98992.1 response regulator [Paludibacteraceae bacterium]HOJ66764.1 response regulator [Paludibacteraceae bacterium]